MSIIKDSYPGYMTPFGVPDQDAQLFPVYVTLLDTPTGIQALISFLPDCNCKLPPSPELIVGEADPYADPKTLERDLKRLYGLQLPMQLLFEE